jgi:hypothetical protein
MQIEVTFATTPETSRVLNATLVQVTNGGLDIYRGSRKIAHIVEGHWRSWVIVEETLVPSNASITVSVDGKPLRTVVQDVVNATLKDLTDSIGNHRG